MKVFPGKKAVHGYDSKVDYKREMHGWSICQRAIPYPKLTDYYENITCGQCLRRIHSELKITRAKMSKEIEE